MRRLSAPVGRSNVTIIALVDGEGMTGMTKAHTTTSSSGL
jgi:hypothetical protein